jgi:hypothetical protein
MVVLNKVLSTTERNTIMSYLNTKWGVAKNLDTDGDGIADKNDAFPLDGTTYNPKIKIQTPVTGASFAFSDTITLSVSANVGSAFDGKYQYKINSPFTTVANGTNVATVLTNANLVVTPDASYTVYVALVTSQNQLVSPLTTTSSAISVAVQPFVTSGILDFSRTHTMSGALDFSVQTNKDVYIGQLLTGTLYMTSAYSLTARKFVVADDTLASGNIFLSPGIATLNVNASANVGNKGKGEIKQTNGYVNFKDGLILGKQSGSKGTYRLQGGELNVWGVIDKGQGTATMNWTSGVIKSERVNFDLDSKGTGRLSPGH